MSGFSRLSLPKTVHSIRESHSCARPSILFLRFQPTLRLTSYRTMVRSRQVQKLKKTQQESLWNDVNPFEQNSALDSVRRQQKARRKAHLLRWNGGRSMFLGSYRHRRDAAFIRGDSRAVDRLRHPAIDRLFSKQGVLNYPCAKGAECTRRQFDVGGKFGLDLDLSGIDLFLMAAKEQLAGKEFNLNLSSPKVNYHRPKSTNLPDRLKTRQLSIMLHSKIKKLLLKEDLILVRAMYEYLIDNLLNRSYMPGLLRLLIHSLAVRDQWQLIVSLLCRAVQRKKPFLCTQNVAALHNYATSLSIRLKAGQREIRHLSRFLRFRRVSNWQSPIHKHKSYFQTLKDQHLPPVPGIDTEIRQGATTQRAIAPAVNSRDLFPYLADWSIRFHVATLNLERAVDMVVDLAKFHVVPNSRTINIILSEMLRQLRDDLKEQPSNLPPLPKVSTASCSLPNRTYHTFPNSPSDITRLPICFKSISTPWVKRIISWEEFSMHQVVNNHSASLLNKLLPYLNQNNIHSSTIRLLAKLSTYASQLEMPWEIAARAKHPKTVLQKAQEQLVAAACEESISSPETRHIQLSKVFLPIMKLEGMSIIPSRESLLITLHACVKDGNIIGARALVNRLTGYGYTLDQREVAELVKCLPTRGIGTLSTPTGEILSSMEMRTEQLAFILELRPFISDPAYLGSYVLALGRCGSAVQIWETWESVRDEKLKDGTVTTFVEGFIQARDLLSAIEFARIVYHLGYPLNYQRAQAIAGGIVRGQRRIGIELINEMVRQNCDLDQKEMEQIISSMLTSQGFALELLNSSQLRLISDSSGELVEIIKARMEGEDIHCALGEIDLALEILDQ